MNFIEVCGLMQQNVEVYPGGKALHVTEEHFSNKASQEVTEGNKWPTRG